MSGPLDAERGGAAERALASAASVGSVRELLALSDEAGRVEALKGAALMGGLGCLEILLPGAETEAMATALDWAELEAVLMMERAGKGGRSGWWTGS